ncbi:MAG: endopeptidase La [Fimbriimonadaceae bacterium]
MSQRIEPDIEAQIEEALGVAAEEAIEEDSGELKPVIPEELVLLPLRDAVVFPMLIAPLSVGRPNSINLIDEAVSQSSRVIGVIAQRNPQIDEPTFDDMFEYGCAVVIRTLMRVPDSVRLIVQGVVRFRIVERLQEQPYLRAKIEVLGDEPITPDEAEEVEALRRSVAALFEQAVRLTPQLPDELLAMTTTVREPNVMADLVAAHMPLSLQDKQGVLEALGTKERLRKLLEVLGREVRVLELTSKVHSEVSAELSKSQREYYLREQLKAIQRELGEGDDTGAEIEDLREKIEEAQLPEAALKEATRELERLARINPASPEYSVARTYVETMASLPWSVSTADNLDLEHARTVLDDDHSGLIKIKDRIIEFLAVRKVKSEGTVRQPILCFYGPPGVGKTSLGMSIARALDRKFVRISLGGMRDEAEIRGHRRTYIGALPGQIIQGLRRAESNNPVFMLDEVDKLGTDFRGDPASALLEVLDPQQNFAFRDHYIDAPFDLANVFFLTTANRLDTIPGPLRDRMEVIELGGYTEEEKLEIAKDHLVPRQLSEHGLRPSQLQFKDDALTALIRGYTREAGVRNLEREIANVTRKATLQFANGRKAKLTATKRFVAQSLGAPRFQHDLVTERKLLPGTAVGLAWTPMGGDLLFVETALLPGTKGLLLTGQAGDVMRESATTALSYVRARAKELKIDPATFEKNEIHIHLPEGAVPKDGPSAGVTMVCALVSLLTGESLTKRLAMTGEVTLTGQVLVVGGIKEKVLAAHRAGVETVILPTDNRKDYEEDIPEKIRAQLKVKYVANVGQALRAAFPD